MSHTGKSLEELQIGSTKEKIYLLAKVAYNSKLYPGFIPKQVFETETSETSYFWNLNETEQSFKHILFLAKNAQSDISENKKTENIKKFLDFLLTPPEVILSRQKNKIPISKPREFFEEFIDFEILENFKDFRVDDIVALDKKKNALYRIISSYGNGTCEIVRLKRNKADFEEVWKDEVKCKRLGLVRENIKSRQIKNDVNGLAGMLEDEDLYENVKLKEKNKEYTVGDLAKYLD